MYTSSFTLEITLFEIRSQLQTIQTLFPYNCLVKIKSRSIICTETKSQTGLCGPTMSAVCHKIQFLEFFNCIFSCTLTDLTEKSFKIIRQGGFLLSFIKLIVMFIFVFGHCAKNRTHVKEKKFHSHSGKKR